MGFLSSIFDDARDNNVPRYTYDPTSQQYALVGQPVATSSSGPFAGIGGLIAALFREKGADIFGNSNLQRFTYDPASQQYTRLASGGQVMNSGLAAAQHAQSMGRGQDSMLVHMTPGEVKGLQALAMSHGGSLTINPQTGLPEAGILSAVLPMAAGFALGPAGFGLMSSLGAGLTVGGLTALATGSLGKGLMAGLGAYGGSGIGQGLQAAAGTAENLASANAASEIALETQKQALAQGATQEAANEAFRQAYLGNLAAPAAAPTGFDVFTKGVPAMFGDAGRSAFMAAAPTGTIPTTMTTALSAYTPKQPGIAGPVKGKANIRPYSLEVTNKSRDFTPYTFEDSSERQMLGYNYSPQPMYQAAAGGEVNPDYNMETGGVAAFSDAFAAGGSTGLDALSKKRKMLKGEPVYKFAQDRRDSSMEASIDQNFAAGGLKAALPPRFLSGGGDGMSDSIKANIDGKQPARLADGEFVVPADVVSHLGNGSSKAGAKKLYTMMDRIRQARTGKKSQAPEVKAHKYMPA